MVTELKWVHLLPPQQLNTVSTLLTATEVNQLTTGPGPDHNTIETVMTLFNVDTFNNQNRKLANSIIRIIILCSTHVIILLMYPL